MQVIGMMQDFVEATHIAITKAIWIAVFQLFHYWIGRKLNLILKLEVATLNELLHSFVANFARYISAKYYLNWFSFHTVTMKVLGVNFFLKHSVVVRVCYENIHRQRFNLPLFGMTRVSQYQNSELTVNAIYRLHCPQILHKHSQPSLPCFPLYMYL